LTSNLISELIYDIITNNKPNTREICPQMSRIVLTCLKASPFTQFEDDGCFCQHRPIVKQYSNKVKLSNKINLNKFSHRKMHVQVKQADTCTTGDYILWHHFTFKQYTYAVASMPSSQEMDRIYCNKNTTALETA